MTKDKHKEEKQYVWNTSRIRKLLCHIITSDSLIKDRPNCRLVDGTWNINNIVQKEEHILKRIRKLFSEK